MAEPYRLAVMGDRESIQGFAAVGLDTFPCEAPDEAAKLFRRLCAGNYGVVYLTEETAARGDSHPRGEGQHGHRHAPSAPGGGKGGRRGYI